MDVRICRTCKVEKPMEDFAWKYKDKGVRQDRCKPCTNAYYKEYRTTRKEYLRQQSKESYIKHKEQKLAHKKDYYQQNKEKKKAYQRERYRKRRETGEAQRENTVRRLKYNFGMTVEDYENMAIAQDYCCAICHQKKKLVVDHCHKTGHIRGLLCVICNTYIGTIRESTESLERAIQYLQKVHD